MNWNNHSSLEGTHAILGASKYHWLNYSDDGIAEYYTAAQAAARGTRLHAFAAECIKLGQKLPKSNRTLNLYVNDAIGFGMTPEVILYYSRNCYGCADAINFSKNVLRIHDYKSGNIVAKMQQLYIYDALFCMEYHVKPGEIQHVLRIYQNDGFVEEQPGADIILPVMDRIKRADLIIEKLREREE